MQYYQYHILHKLGFNIIAIVNIITNIISSNFLSTFLSLNSCLICVIVHYSDVLRFLMKIGKRESKEMFQITGESR